MHDLDGAGRRVRRPYIVDSDIRGQAVAERRIGVEIRVGDEIVVPPAPVATVDRADAAFIRIFRADDDMASPIGEAGAAGHGAIDFRSEEHTSELQSLMRLSYAVFC